MRLAFFVTAAVLATLARVFAQNPKAIARMDDLKYPFPVEKVAIDDSITLAYMAVGKGPKTALFIHGSGSYAPAWKNNMAALSTTYRCIAIDLPGYGRSSKGEYSGTMAFYAQVVAAFIQTMGLEKPHVVGHSMGGQVAMVLALASPELVDKLVLVAPAGFETFTPGDGDWLTKVSTPEAIAKTPEGQIRANYAYNFHQMPDEAQFMVNDRLAMRQAKGFDAYCLAVSQGIRGMLGHPVYDQLPEIGHPTLVVFGEGDKLIPNRFLHKTLTTKAVAEAGHGRIKNSKLVMVPEAGHFVMFEQAARVNQAIADFLKQV